MSDSTANPSVLHRLKAGIRRYQSEVHAERAAEYQRAATTPQQPHTLVIACADSRVDVESIASAGPGELFITRNIGNMVPSYPRGDAVLWPDTAALQRRHGCWLSHG